MSTVELEDFFGFFTFGDGLGEGLMLGESAPIGEGEGEGDPLPIGSVVVVGVGDELPLIGVVVVVGVDVGEDNPVGIAVGSDVGAPIIPPPVAVPEGIAILLGIRSAAFGFCVSAKAGIAKINPSTPAKVMKVFGEVIEITLKFGLRHSIIHSSQLAQDE